MITFRAGKLKIVFKFGFFFSSAMLCLTDTIGTAMCILCSCVIHEIGHIIAAVLSDVKLESITFGFGGIKMTSESRIKSLHKDIFILLCGPLFNMAAAFFYYISANYTSFSINLILALFNLLPFSNLDGGAMIIKVLSYMGVYSVCLIKTVALFTAVVICILLYMWSVENFMMYVIIIFLAVCQFSID